MKKFITIIGLCCSLSIAIVNAQTNNTKSHSDVRVPLIPPNDWSRPGFHLSNGNIDLLISGQLNQDVFVADDGARRRVFYGDNDVSASTLRFTAVAKTSDCFNFFSIIEFGIQDQSSRDVSQINPIPGNNFILRIGEVGIDSKCYGKLSLGQGYTATDYTAEVDLSGIDMVENSAIQKMGGGIIFSDASDGSLTGNPAIKNVFDNLDGLSRRTRLRYDTPIYKGFQLSGSVIEQSNADIALRYSEDFKVFKISAAIGLASSSVIHDPVEGRNLDGSISVLLINGLNFTFASGTVFANESGRNDPAYQYGKLGYRADYFCVGKTSFGIDYGSFRSFARNGDKGNVYGGAIAQNFAPWNADIYLAARHYTLDRSCEDHSCEAVNPINLVVAGIRMKF